MPSLIVALWLSGRLKGRIVRVANTRKTAMVSYVMKSPYGAVCLDRPIEGFRYWNIDELELLP